MALEDNGKFKDAAKHFVEAGKPKEAVLMYVHTQNWDEAQRVAEEAGDRESVAEVLVGQAKVAFENADFAKFEALLLRAERPELAVRKYKDAGMWPEALRVCKLYLPRELIALQDEYDRESAGGASDAGGVARQWEAQGEYERAVEAYLKLEDDPESLLRAGELAAKFLEPDRAAEVATTAGPRLLAAGHHSSAAQLYLSVEMIREAVDAFAEGGEWAKARKVAKELEPRLTPYVEQRYKIHLQNQGQFEELINVDLERALRVLVDQGEWERAIDTAAEHGQELKHKYVAHYAAELIQQGRATDALQLYRRHTAPPMPQNFNIYKRMAVDLFNSPSSADTAGRMYPIWSGLRDVLFDLTENLQQGGDAYDEFRLLLLISHYLATRAACQTQSELKDTAARLSVTMLRHSDVLPADKAFYEAGSAARDAGWEGTAFVLFNRFLDLCEAIEEKVPDMLDHSDLVDTDIPAEVPLPEEPSLSMAERESVKEWVLAISMDQRVQPTLPLDARGVFEGSLLDRSGQAAPACIITGYPVLGPRIEFARGMIAIKEQWNNFVMKAKMAADGGGEVNDVIRFIGAWGGMAGGTTPGFSFQ